MKKPKPRVGSLIALANKLKSKLVLTTIKQNRYLDIGDWYDNHISAVEQNDPRSTFGVLIHELTEFILCEYFGISANEVDKQDLYFLAGKIHHTQRSYWKQHLVALKIERILIEALGLSWAEHDKNCRAAFKQQAEILEKGLKTK